MGSQIVVDFWGSVKNTNSTNSNVNKYVQAIILSLILSPMSCHFIYMYTFIKNREKRSI